MNRYNHDLNGYFLCDRGRFGIGFVNSSNRIKSVKGINTKVGEPSVGMFNEKSFAKAMAQHSGEHFIGVGSARASFEANRLLKYLVGKENFSLGYTNQEMQLALRHKQLLAQYPQQSLAGIENRVQHGNGEKEHDLVLIIGEIVEQTAPRLALTLQQVLRNAALDKADSIGVKHWQDSAVRTYAGNTCTPLFSLQTQTSDFDQNAKGALLLSPQRIIHCVSKLTKMLKDDFAISDTVVSLSGQVSPDTNSFDDNDTVVDSSNHEDKFLLLLAQMLSQAKMPLIVTGLSLKSAELLAAIDELMACLSQKSHGFSPELTVIAPECNSVGNLHFLSEYALSIEQIVERCVTNTKEQTSLVMLEQDLSQLTKKQSRQLRQHCKTMIVLDHTKNDLTDVADIVLPIAAVTESNGHFVNFQGRLQRFSSVHIPSKPIMENWHWLGLLGKYLFNHQEANFSNLEQLQSFFAKHGEAWALQVLTNQSECKKQGSRGVARQTHRASGRTAMMANQSVHEVKTYCESSKNNDFNYSMEGTDARKSSEMPYTWSPQWNSNQSVFQHQQEVNGELINTMNENLLNLTLSVYFDESAKLSVAEKLNQLWPVMSVEQADKLTVIQNIPWFLAEQQTRSLPEFILMFSGNSISVSADFAKQNNIQPKDILKLSLNEQVLFAKVKIDKIQPENTMLISLIELPLSQNNFSLAADNISKATDDEIANFQQNELNRVSAAQQEKADVLARLKIQDKTIPIAFYEYKGEGNG